MHHNQRTHSIKKPNGCIEEVTSLCGFAATEGLQTHRLSRLVNGHINSYKGYTLVSEVKPKKSRAYKLTKEDKLFNLAMGMGK